MNCDEDVMTFRYLVGQIVRAKGQFPGRAGKKLYQIVRLLPVADHELPRYCVRSVQDGVEWTAAQDGLEPESALPTSACCDLELVTRNRRPG